MSRFSLFQSKPAGSTKRAVPRSSFVCLFLLGGAVILAVPANGQTPDDPPDHSCTLNVGAGFAQAAGNERSNLNQGWNFHAGGGFALTPPPAQGHKWSLFLTANFMFDQMGIKQTALQQARVMNPTDIGLLEATSGKAKFYSTTLDPTFRIPVRGRFSLYLFAGFGWFRRDLEFTGSSSQGALLQPGSPVVFGNGGNSGAYDAGAGVDVRLPRALGGLMFYAEARVLHGLAVNNATTLVPISAGLRW